CIPQDNIDDKGYWDNGCSRHMTSNISYLSEYEPFNGGYVSFGHGRGKIIGKGLIKTDGILANIRDEDPITTPLEDLVTLVVVVTAGETLILAVATDRLTVVKTDLKPPLARIFAAPKGVLPLETGTNIHQFLKFLLHTALTTTKRSNPWESLPISDISCWKCNLICSRQWDEPSKHTLCGTLQEIPLSGAMVTAGETLILAVATDRLAVVKTNLKPPLARIFAASKLVLVRKASPYLTSPVGNAISSAPGLPSKSFENDHYCVACLKGKQHKASCKFDAKGDDGNFVRYSLSSKAFRVHQAVKEKESPLRFIALLNWFYEAQMAASDAAASKDDAIPVNNAPQQEQQEVNGEKEFPERSGHSNPTASKKVSTNNSFELASSSIVENVVPTVSTPIPTDNLSAPSVTLSVTRIISRGGSSFPEPLSLGNAMSFENKLEDFFGDTSNAVSLNEVKADLSNMKTSIQVSPTPTLRIHKYHPKKPKKIVDALKDPSWVEAMKQELLQFKIQNVWVLVNCTSGVRPIGTKWVLKNKKDERGIVIRNKELLVAQGHTQEEGIDYEEVFAPVARIEAIRLFLAYASNMGFIVYQMDVKSDFLYGTIDEEWQPSKLAVGSGSASGNSITGSENALCILFPTTNEVQSSWQWLHFSSSSGNLLNWQWEVVLPVGTL
nr:copia protein [Tanacetum cinerariifolium]